MRTFIRINEKAIKHNAKTKELEPVLKVKTGSEEKNCHEALILNEKRHIVAKVTYSPTQQGSSKISIETDLTVKPVMHSCPNIIKY